VVEIVVDIDDVLDTKRVLLPHRPASAPLVPGIVVGRRGRWGTPTIVPRRASVFHVAPDIVPQRPGLQRLGFRVHVSWFRV